jgi:hypothetical protein
MVPVTRSTQLRLEAIVSEAEAFEPRSCLERTGNCFYISTFSRVRPEIVDEVRAAQERYVEVDHQDQWLVSMQTDCIRSEDQKHRAKERSN